MASGPGSELTCGTRDHRADATRQGCGWPTRDASGAQDADTWQEAMRVHVGARVVRHVAGEVDR